MQEVYIGALGLQLEDTKTCFQIKLPPNYYAFKPSSSQREAINPSFTGVDMPPVTGCLIFHWQAQPTMAPFIEAHLVHHNVLWELRQDLDGNYVFINSQEPDELCLVVAGDFTEGQIVGAHRAALANSHTLFSSLGMPLFTNWLGTYGDLILHTSCVVVGGKGYCFPGPSGVGKSTLATQLASEHTLTILGDDHIILRYLEGQYWVFGSPWHQNLTQCVPLGVPLERLIFLDRDVTPGMHALSPLEGVSRVLQTALIPYYRPDLTDRILARLATLAEEVPFFTLNYNLGTDPLDLILG